MHYYGHRLKHLLVLTALMFAIGSSAGEAKQDSSIHVIASVKPVAALLEVVMEGVAKPGLLLSAHDSPHHFSLRPSQARELKADMIYYISDDYEYFLKRPLKQLSKEKAVMELAKAPGLVLLPLRKWEKDNAAKSTETDPHFWLLPQNVKLLARYMAETLAARYPGYAETFRENTDRFIIKMDAIEKTANDDFAPFKGKGFAAFHDGYQYLEKAFGLKMVAVLSDPSFHQLSPSALQKIRKQARKGEIACLVGEPREGRDITASLHRQLKIPTIELDPEGGSLDGAGTEYWQRFYADMAQKFINCFEGSAS